MFWYTKNQLSNFNKSISFPASFLVSCVPLSLFYYAYIEIIYIIYLLFDPPEPADKLTVSRISIIIVYGIFIILSEYVTQYERKT